MPHHSILRPNAALLLTALLAGSGCSGNDQPDGDGGGAGSGGASGYCQTATQALVSGSGIPKNPAIPLSETPVPESAC
ncbi:MAG TPA: hypothetical protein VMS65_13425, partial [Polyangiaceae bacterium]|nr:hypothetical protein [Polyangiaceae bacterium]